MEEWRDVNGYEGVYQVSNYGRVKSLARIVAVKDKNGILRNRPYLEKILTQQVGVGGYMRVALCKDGGIKIKYVHRLVLETFETNGIDMECRHLDNNPANNRLDNLCWGTPLENQHDRVLNKTNPIGERNGRAKVNATQVIEIKNRINNGETLTAIAKSLNVTKSLISQINTGKTWSHV